MVVADRMQSITHQSICDHHDGVGCRESTWGVLKSRMNCNTVLHI